MKYIYLLLFMSLFSFGNVYADTMGDFCSNENLIPFINIFSIAVNLIKIGVPIILIILGMIDMVKAVTSQKEDKIKAGQKNLLSRCLNGAIVFFVVAIVQLLMNIIVKATGENNIMNCVCKFIGGCTETKTVIDGNLEHTES